MDRGQLDVQTSQLDRAYILGLVSTLPEDLAQCFDEVTQHWLDCLLTVVAVHQHQLHAN